MGSLRLVYGEGRCYLTHSHTYHTSHLPSSFSGEDGRPELPSQNLHGHSSYAAWPSCPLVPFSGDWDEPRNRVTESTVGYLWSTWVCPSSPWNTGLLYVFSSTFLPAASVQPIHGSYTFTNKNRRAGRQEANTIAWEILGALGRMTGEAMGWHKVWGWSLLQIFRITLIQAGQLRLLYFVLLFQVLCYTHYC